LVLLDPSGGKTGFLCLFEFLPLLFEFGSLITVHFREIVFLRLVISITILSIDLGLEDFIGFNASNTLLIVFASCVSLFVECQQLSLESLFAFIIAGFTVISHCCLELGFPFFSFSHSGSPLFFECIGISIFTESSECILFDFTPVSSQCFSSFSKSTSSDIITRVGWIFFFFFAYDLTFTNWSECNWSNTCFNVVFSQFNASS